MQALVIIPTYNEAGNVVRVIERVRAAVPAAEILVVDDGSPDGTADLAEGAGRDLGSVSVLRRDGKHGLGSAYRAGFRWGLERGAPILIEMDADLQHDPDALPGLIAPIEMGTADLVIGSRYVPGGAIPNWRWHRRLLSVWGNRYAGAMLSLGVRDATAGFRAYRNELMASLDLDRITADGYGFQIEMAYQSVRAGGRVVEVPIRFGERQVGESKMSSSVVVEALRLVTWWALRDRLLRRSPRPGSSDRPPSGP